MEYLHWKVHLNYKKEAKKMKTMFLLTVAAGGVCFVILYVAWTVLPDVIKEAFKRLRK